MRYFLALGIKKLPPYALAVLLAFSATLLWLAGCDVLRGDDSSPCGGEATGMSIRTDQNAYNVEEEATVTIRNCTGEDVFLWQVGYLHYTLQKNTGDEWKAVFTRTSLYLGTLEKLESGEAREEVLPVRPRETSVDTVAGSYRFQFFIYDRRLSEEEREELLASEERTSNVFTVME